MTGRVTSGPFSLAFESDNSQEEAVRRLIAYFLVSAMPAPGLDETVTTLHEMLEFHDEGLRLAPARRPVGKLGSGTVSRLEDRPAFALGR